MNNLPEKKNDVGSRNISNNECVTKPSLYSSIIETESKLRHITRSRLERNPVSHRAGTREVNFPLTQQVYDYANMVDVGLNSGVRTIKKPKPREFHSRRQPEPKLSDYYQPSFDNVQRIQMDSVQTSPELTVQYDGLAVSRLLNEIDDLVFR